MDALDAQYSTKLPGLLSIIALILLLLYPFPESTMVRRGATSSFGSDATTTTTTLPQKTPWPTTFTDGLPLPKIVVFDLDYTLWPFWVDTHVTGPLKAQEGGLKVKDRYGEGYGFYSDVGGILEAVRSFKNDRYLILGTDVLQLKQKGILIGAASRTHAPDLGREMLKLLKIPPSSSSSSAQRAIDYFDHLQIYPGNKQTHFERIHRDSGIAYEDMLFFDDESRNKNVEVLGVVMQLVRDGVSMNEIDAGVKAWRKRHNKASN